MKEGGLKVWEAKLEVPNLLDMNGYLQGVSVWTRTFSVHVTALNTHPESYAVILPSAEFPSQNYFTLDMCYFPRYSLCAVLQQIFYSSARWNHFRKQLKELNQILREWNWFSSLKVTIVTSVKICWSHSKSLILSSGVEQNLLVLQILPKMLEVITLP